MLENAKQSLVTAIKKNDKIPKRYDVFLDEEYAFSVHEDTLVKHSLLKGKWIDECDLNLIVFDDLQQKAYNDGIRYISRRSRTTQEVRLKLKQKGYNPETIDYVITRLIEHCFLDDVKYAQSWTAHRVSSSKYGRNRIQQELKEKGLNKHEIYCAIEGIDEREELKSAMSVGQKKWSSLGNNDKHKRQKCIAFLLRRGFSQRVIKQVFQKLQTSSVEIDDEIEI